MKKYVKTVYGMARVYGPYEWKDGRLRVCLVMDNGERKTVSYPKFVVQEHLGKVLKDNEVVHHKDHNPLNNDVDNLEVFTSVEHGKGHARKLKAQKFVCPLCKKEFVLSGKRLRGAHRDRYKGKIGPFCGRSCAGKVTHSRESYERFLRENPDVVNVKIGREKSASIL